MSKHAFSFGFAGAMVLGAAFVAPAAHADTIRYRYVALDQIPLPAPYTSFAPSAVIDGRVFGTVFDDSFSIGAVAVYRHGALTIGPAGFASVANEDGTIGGSDLSAQAALFKDGATTLVPRLPGELFSNVVGLGDDHLALVSSTNSSFVTSFAYFRKGTETVIDFGLPDPVFGGFMNDDGLVGVTKEESQSDPFLHGYRYDPRTQTSTLLPPFAGDPTDVMVLVQGINSRGEVLGYSFTDFASPTYHERVGVWDRAAVFHPFFEETITTNTLVFNDRDQIVITNSSDSHSYLVPRPGTRLDLASIVGNVPAGLDLAQVVSIDNDANITGFAADATLTNFYPFLLVPLGDGDRDGGEVHLGGRPLPWAIAHDCDKRHPHK
jgi:hypothetical protein